MKKLFLFSVLILSFFSCSENNKDEDELFANDFRGAYKIFSMTTELPFDLNNDDFQSTNYLEEISLPYKLHNGQIVNYGFTPKPTPQSHSLLFEKDSFSQFNPNPDSKTVGAGMFFNSTRVQVRDMTKQSC